jgi:hypothetical protein
VKIDPEPIYVGTNNVYTSDGVSAGMGPDWLYKALQTAIADSNATVHVIGKESSVPIYRYVSRSR